MTIYIYLVIAPTFYKLLHGERTLHTSQSVPGLYNVLQHICIGSSQPLLLLFIEKICNVKNYRTFVDSDKRTFFGMRALGPLTSFPLPGVLSSADPRSCIPHNHRANDGRDSQVFSIGYCALY